MAEGDYPLKIAALAVVGTIGVATIVVTQWVLPTVSASLNYENTVLKAKVSKAEEEKSALKQSGEQELKLHVSEKAEYQKKLDTLTFEAEQLKQQLFALLKANAFSSGIPYPVGLDKVKFGDSIERIYSAYPRDRIKEEGKTLITVSGVGELFAEIKYVHSYTKATQGSVFGVQYRLNRSDSASRKKLEIPVDWLEQALTKTLGNPRVVGSDDACLFWRVSDLESVYYKKSSDWFHVMSQDTYLAGCHHPR